MGNILVNTNSKNNQNTCKPLKNNEGQEALFNLNVMCVEFSSSFHFIFHLCNRSKILLRWICSSWEAFMESLDENTIAVSLACAVLDLEYCTFNFIYMGAICQFQLDLTNDKWGNLYTSFELRIISHYDVSRFSSTNAKHLPFTRLAFAE